MKLPLQIAFQHADHSDAIEALVRKKAARLDKFFDHIMSCRVVVEAPHKHHERGNLYRIRLDITVPGGEIAVNRESAQHVEYKDIQVAARDAFNAARRRLEDYVRRLRGEVKTHRPARPAAASPNS